MKMKKYFSVILPMILACSFGLVFSTPAYAAKQLEVGNTSVNSSEDERQCDVPITLKGDFSDVNGLAFTLTYDSDVFEFLGLVQADKEVYNGDDYDPPDQEPSADTIENALFYIANPIEEEGRVMMAAAAANYIVNDTNDVVPFIARFRVYEGADPGVYEIGAQKTVIGPDTAAEAGYNEPTELDVAVGLDPEGEPTDAVSYTVELIAGSITVTSTHILSGKVTVNGEVLDSVQVMVMEGDEIVGVYPLDEDGNFEITVLDSGMTFTVKAVYGSEVSGVLEPGEGDVYNWDGLGLGAVSGTVYDLSDGRQAMVHVESEETQLEKIFMLTGDGSDQEYVVDKLLPGDDYIVSIVGTGIQVIYYDGQTDIENATFVTVEADSVTEGIDFTVEEDTGPILDIDANGQTNPFTDVVMIVRYLFGFRGQTLIQGAIDLEGNRNTASDVEAYIAAILSAGYLDVDGNGVISPFEDVVMIVRRLFGFSGTALISGAIGSGSTRDADEIAVYIDS
ncbi:MAG TPA: hypothetical protein ENN79_09960, partial [Desulfobacteraceae bacterium]|nr:hypothetical protein [Desulfobacteraceae bacterium]